MLILLLVVGGAYLQFQWMQRAREAGAENIMPSPFAEKLQKWMLMKKGLEPGAPGATAPGGAEKIVCDTCLGTGTYLPDTCAPSLCPVCLVVGFPMTRRLDPADHLCPLCAGMGRVSADGEVGVCPRCGGRGLVRSPAPDAAAAPVED